MPLEDRKGIFAPTGGTKKDILFTFIYLVFLVLVLQFLISMLSGDSMRDFVELFGDALFEGNIIFLIFLPLISAILIHKPTFKKLIIVTSMTFGLFFVFLFAILSEEERGYLILGSILVVPISIGILFLITFLGRVFFRIPSKILRIFLLALPFLIMFLLIVVASFNCSFNKDYECVALKAVSTGNLSACESVAESLRTGCYVQLAYLTGDYSWCYKEGFLAGEGCSLKVFYELNKNNKISPSTCTNIADLAGRDRCYTALAAITKDPSICKKILKLEEYDCYKNIVWNGGDRTLCSNILDDNRRIDCLNLEYGRNFREWLESI